MFTASGICKGGGGLGGCITNKAASISQLITGLPRPNLSGLAAVGRQRFHVVLKVPRSHRRPQLSWNLTNWRILRWWWGVTANPPPTHIQLRLSAKTVSGGIAPAF